MQVTLLGNCTEIAAWCLRKTEKCSQ